LIVSAFGRPGVPARFLAALICCGALWFALPAAAYIGPGAGASVAGSLLNTLLVVLLAIVAIVFWPVRLLWRKLRARGKQPPEGEGSGPRAS
jgi:bacteriorhodopsin